jgi:hypothetical protein
MSETLQSPQPKKELFSLPPEKRRVEAVRKVSEMTVASVGAPENGSFPVELRGYAEHANALIDLLFNDTGADSFGLVIHGGKNLRADTRLAQKLEHGFLPVNGRNRNTTILDVEEKPNGECICKFGYSTNGTSMVRALNGGIDVSRYDSPSRIADESLLKLYKLTGKIEFMENLGTRIEQQGSASPNTLKRIDPNGHYAALGLNPYALKFLDEDYFNTLVVGIRKEVAKKLHPDTGANPSEEDMDHLTKVLGACDVLGNPDKRKEYSSWL